MAVRSRSKKRVAAPKPRSGSPEAEAAEPSHPELVVGIVAAVGTPIDLAVRLIAQSIENFSYAIETLHLSHYTDQFKLTNRRPPSTASSTERIDAMMSRGTEAREITGRDDVLALAAIADIHVRRGGQDAARSGSAYVLRQLKHPDEIYLLRETYGEGFLALGFYSPRVDRERHLREGGAKESEIKRLIERDAHEGLDSGQRFRDTFHLADAFVRIGSDSAACEQELRRIFSLIFGAEIIAPRRDEFGMFQAFGAALRSAQMGRQVGAALLSDLGDVIAVGTNEVPRAGGGSYWEGIEPDGRDHRRGADSNDEMKSGLVAEVVQRLVAARILEAKRAGPDLISQATTALSSSRLDALIEFGRSVHAEADAIAAAGRLGVSTRGADLFCTTFPCHLCAKQIIAAGIGTVTFIEPYPKSLAEELHGDAICLEEHEDGKVLFKPFVGVAPRRYAQLFSMLSPVGRVIDRKDKTGMALDSLFRPRLRMPYFSALERERLVSEQLGKITNQKGES
jgi:deoxycytidylate deaminase